MIDVHQIEQLIQQDDQQALREALSSFLKTQGAQEIEYMMAVCLQKAINLKRAGGLVIILDAMEDRFRQSDKNWLSNPFWQTRMLTMLCKEVDMFDVVGEWMNARSQCFNLSLTNTQHIFSFMHPCVIEHFVSQISEDVIIMHDAIKALIWRRDKDALQFYDILYPMMNEDIHRVILGRFLEFHNYTDEQKQMIDRSYTMERMHHLFEYNGRRGYLEPRNYLVQRLLADETKLAISKEVDHTAAGHKVRKL